MSEHDTLFGPSRAVKIEQSKVLPIEDFEKTKTIPCYNDRHEECQAAFPNGCECECHNG